MMECNSKRSGGYSESSGEGSCSSLEKRRRVEQQRHRQQRPGGVSLKHARAAFANNSGHKEIRLPVNVRRQHSSSSCPARLSRSRRLPSPPLPQEREVPTTPTGEVPSDVPEVIINKSPSTPSKQQNEDVPDLTAENQPEEDIISYLFLQELQRDDSKAVARALEKLGSIFKHQDPILCHQAIHQLGGHSLLLSSLQTWCHDRRVARHGCHALFRMIGTYTKNYNNTYTTPPSSPQREQAQPQTEQFDLVESLLHLGAASVLLQVMNGFASNCEVQLYAMGALGNLFKGGVGSRGFALKLVVEQGGVLAIVRSMQEFPHHAKVQEFGCWLCARLSYCLGHTTSQAVMKDQALVAVSTAVQNHPRHAAIDKQAGNFMATLFGISAGRGA